MPKKKTKTKKSSNKTVKGQLGKKKETAREKMIGQTIGYRYDVNLLPDYSKITPFLKKYIEAMGWDDLNWLEDVHMGYEDDKDDYKILMAKIKCYLFLNSDFSFSLDELEILLEDKKLSSKQKNIIVKYYELMTDQKISNYWKTPNDLNRVSSVITNVKLDEYLKSLDNQVGEMILLLNLIHGDQKFINLHETTIFTIIEGLINIDPVYANQYVFEYLTKDTL